MSGISKIIGPLGVESVKIPCCWDPRDNVLVSLDEGEARGHLVFIRVKRRGDLPGKVENIGVALRPEDAIQFFESALAVAYCAYREDRKNDRG